MILTQTAPGFSIRCELLENHLVIFNRTTFSQNRYSESILVTFSVRQTFYLVQLTLKFGPLKRTSFFDLFNRSLGSFLELQKLSISAVKYWQKQTYCFAGKTSPDRVVEAYPCLSDKL